MNGVLTPYFLLLVFDVMLTNRSRPHRSPGFHGVFGIDTNDGEANHTKGFTRAAGTEEAFEMALETGKAMALVGWKVLADDAFAESTWKEWEEDMKLAAKGE